MGASKPQSRLMVLMFTDLVGSVDFKRRLGDAAFAPLIRKHDELFRYTVSAFPLAEVLKDLGDGFLARFSSASDAVHAALHFQNALHTQAWDGPRLKARIGLHLGEVSELDLEEATGKAKVSGLAVDIAARVMALALPGQILMTRAAFDNARQYVREHQSSDGSAPAITRKWMAHGRYMFKGAEEPLEVFEVGELGIAPLAVPPDSDKARRSVAADQEETLGWRPAVGLEIPDRKSWVLDRKLGEGGFGEVWLGEHVKTHTRRVFKFCFDSERLRSFKREIMLFRLLRDALGDRNDIAKLHEVQVEQAPFYLESEFTEDGSLVEWAQRQGGIGKVPLPTRLDIVARTAVAVSAAHSVGVLHKDIKPSNILVYRGSDSQPLPRLTDFGIGELTDPSQLAKRNITMVAATSSLVDGSDSSGPGTRIYTPPEVLMGKPFTVQGDVYALGVLLYQMVVADLDRPIAEGWERDVADPLLREDISACVEGHAAQRLSSAKQLADRLQNLPARRRARQRKRIARVGIAVSLVLVVLLSLATTQLFRERRLHDQTKLEKTKFLDMADFLVDLVSSVDARDGEGRDVKVVDQLLKGIRDLDENPRRPEVEAELRAAIGRALTATGQFVEAERQLQLALDIRRSLRADDLVIATNLLDLGSAKYFNDQFEEAERLFRECLTLRQARLGEQNLDVARSFDYLGMAYLNMQDYDRAEQLIGKGLQLRRALATGDERKVIAASLNNMGKCLFKQKRYEQAQASYEESLALQRSLRGDRHQDVATGLTNLASCLLERADADFEHAADFYQRASGLLDEALDIKRQWHGNQHSSVAITLHNLAELNLRLRNIGEAEAFAVEALAIRRNTLKAGHPRIDESLDLLADIHALQGRFADAEPLLHEVYVNRAQVIEPNDPRVILAAVRWADCLARLPDKADQMHELLRWSLSCFTGDEYPDKPKPSGPIAVKAASVLLSIFERTGQASEALRLRVIIEAIEPAQRSASSR